MHKSRLSDPQSRTQPRHIALRFQLTGVAAQRALRYLGAEAQGEVGGGKAGGEVGARATERTAGVAGPQRRLRASGRGQGGLPGPAETRVCGLGA